MASHKEAQEWQALRIDLPEALRKVGAGTRVGEVEVTCAIYLDDSHTEQTALSALGALSKYGDRWSKQWPVPKFKMLCINVPTPPGQWILV